MTFHERSLYGQGMVTAICKKVFFKFSNLGSTFLYRMNVNLNLKTTFSASHKVKSSQSRVKSHHFPGNLLRLRLTRNWAE